MAQETKVCVYSCELSKREMEGGGCGLVVDCLQGLRFSVSVDGSNHGVVEYICI